METSNTFRQKPAPWSASTTADLWTDPHVSAQMLKFHLDPDCAPASRPHAFIDRSAAWITEHFQLRAGMSVCDYGCGPGLYTIRFARTGAAVTGIDFSERSLAYARETAGREALNIGYVLADYLNHVPEERFDLITLIYCDFCPLSPAQRQTLLGRFRSALKPGGSVLLDVFTHRLFETTDERKSHEHVETGGFWAPGPHDVCSVTHRYDDEKLLLTKYRIEEPGRVRFIYNWLQCYDLATLGAEFAAAGFEIIETYGNVAGDPCAPEDRELAIVARVASR